MADQLPLFPDPDRDLTRPAEVIGAEHLVQIQARYDALTRRVRERRDALRIAALALADFERQLRGNRV